MQYKTHLESTCTNNLKFLSSHMYEIKVFTHNDSGVNILKIQIRYKYSVIILFVVIVVVAAAAAQ